MNDAASSGSDTDIERFVEDPKRKALVAEVRKKIDELGIEYLYLQFVSVTGRICGKGIPADHWESVAQKGFQLVYAATMNLFVNRRLSASAFRSQRRSCRSRRTRVWRGFVARSSATAKSGTNSAPFSPQIH